MESFVLRPRLPAVLDQPRWERALQCSFRHEFAFRCPALVDSGRISLRRTLDQIRCALSCARFHDLLSFRGYRAAEDSSISISDGRRGPLLVLSVALVDFGIYRIQLGVSDRGGCIDTVDHVVLPVFPRQWRANIDDRRGLGGGLHISLHYSAAAGLCAAYGRDRALYRLGDRDVRDAQGGLVRARHELEAGEKSSW